MTLRVTLEIIPFGVEARKRTIAVANIHNRGPVTDHPQERFYRYGGEFKTDKGSMQGSFKDLVFDRGLGAWPLVKAAIERLLERTDAE
jgi:hypothetical protein